WPVFQTRQLESSPSTQISQNSCSNRSRTRIVSSLTVNTRRERGLPGCALGAGATGGLGAGSGSVSGSSSSNGRSNRSVIGEIRKLLEFFRAQAEALDVCLSAGLLVGFHDHRVQPRVR